MAKKKAAKTKSAKKDVKKKARTLAPEAAEDTSAIEMKSVIRSAFLNRG